MVKKAASGDRVITTVERRNKSLSHDGKRDIGNGRYLTRGRGGSKISRPKGSEYGIKSIDGKIRKNASKSDKPARC